MICPGNQPLPCPTFLSRPGPLGRMNVPRKRQPERFACQNSKTRVQTDRYARRTTSLLKESLRETHFEATVACFESTREILSTSRCQLGSPPTPRCQLGSPPTSRFQLGSPPTYRCQLGSPPTYRFQLGSPPTYRCQLGSPPTYGCHH